MSNDNEEARETLIGLIANWDVLVVPPKQTLGHVHLADALLAAGWLSPEQVEQAKAEVWDEGYDTRGIDIANEGLTQRSLTPNPYTEATA